MGPTVIVPGGVLREACRGLWGCPSFREEEKGRGNPPRGEEGNGGIRRGEEGGGERTEEGGILPNRSW